MTKNAIVPESSGSRTSQSAALALRLVLGLLILVSTAAFLTPDAKAQNNPGFTAVNDRGVAASLTWTGGAGPFLLQKKLNFSDPSWVNVLTTSNRNVILAKEARSGLIRLQDQPTNTVLAFTVLLSPASEVPSVNNSSGSAIGAISLEGSNLNYYVTFSGLSGPATAAHFHASATPTNSAGVVVPLSPPAATSGIIAGSVQLTLAQITNFMSGLCYMNIHTALNPGGEIRGQVVPLRMVLAMNGPSEVPTNPSTGTANGILTFIGSQLFYEINYSGLSASATAAHIHGPASTTTSAGVIVPLNSPSGTAGTIAGTATLTPQNLAYILAGQTYVNIHTTANPGGEIRGQIWPIQFGASMSGASEVPAVPTAGTAQGTMNLISNVLSYNFTFTNLAANATAAHIHGPATPQQNAGVIIPFGGVPAATSGSFSGTALITPQQLFDIISGLTYANIHTTANPGGEVRGQVYPGN
jgi:hypothetical protein